MTRSPHRRAIGTVLFDVLILIALCSLVGLLGRFFWFFDLFNHFRPQAVVAALPLLLLAVLLKHRNSVLLGSAIIVVNLALMAFSWVSFPSAAREAFGAQAAMQQKTILFANVLTSNTRTYDFVTLVKEQNPDVIALAEIDDRWVAALSALENEYPYKHVAPREDNFGIGLYAKHPFDAEIRVAGHHKLPMLVMRAESYSVIVTHPAPPLDAVYANDLQAYMAEVVRQTNQITGPVILAGDLNTTLWSHHLQPLKKAGYHRAGSLPFVRTWPGNGWLFAMQLDHLLVRDAVTTGFRVLPDIGSDHYPIQVQIGWQKSGIR